MLPRTTKKGKFLSTGSLLHSRSIMKADIKLNENGALSSQTRTINYFRTFKCPTLLEANVVLTSPAFLVYKRDSFGFATVT